MDARRWEQISAIFRAALERAPGRREEFVEGACGDDSSLRAEVSSLLSAYEGAGSFMGAPAVEAAGRMLAEGEALSEGEELGAYRILGPIGAGGMGTVYLAEDLRLGRRAALKVLPAELAEDLDRARRFEREARAASSLNHPNILTVYEFGRTDEHFFIAAEYVEGRTLRQTLEASGVLGVGEALDIAAQMAEALSAAHAAGVIHRDVKPENVVVRPDGYVKVLDFGLAKLSERRGALAGGGGDPEGRATLDTTPGMIVGTVKYMSPEQARGLPVDGRTDVWSLGCVLYEMLAGRAAFAGPTQADVLAAVLEREPPALGAHVPEDVARLVARALVKDQALRFQTMGELASELSALRFRPDLRAGLRPSGAGAASPANGAGSRSTGPVRKGAGALTLASEVFDTNPAVEQATAVERGTGGRLARLLNSRAFYAALALLLVASAGATLALRRARQASSASAASAETATKAPPTARFKRLTDLGQLYDPAVSPDGKAIAYVIRESNRASIRLRDLSDHRETQVVPPTDANMGGIVFSPDGRHLYYGQVIDGLHGGTVYRVPVEGGVPPLKIVGGLFGAFGVSPDGKRLAFVREHGGEAGRGVLVVYDMERGAERELGSRGGRTFYAIYGVGPKWSPDGGRLVTPAGEWNGDGTVKGKASNYFIEVSVADGAERRIPSPAWENVDHAAWLSDGSGLVVLAQESKSTPFQIWQLDHTTGAAHRITNDLENYGTLSLTADSRQIVAAKSVVKSKLWLLPEGDWRRARQLTLGEESTDGYYGLTWTHDGRILYVSTEAGSCRIWSMNPDGGERRPLTPDEEVFIRFPSVSPADGRIVYESTRGGGQHIWVMNADGTGARQLTDGIGEGNARVTPDGRSFVYVQVGEWPWSLWRKPLDGGEAVKLSDHVVGLASFSPDGSRILVAYYDPEERVNSHWKLAVIPSGGGPPERLYQPPSFRLLAEWAADGKGFYYFGEKNSLTHSNLWLQPLDGGPPRRVTDFETERTQNFAWSADRRQLVVARGNVRIDAVLISDFR